MRTQSLVDDQGGLSSRLSLILTAFILAWLTGGICLGQGSTGVVEARVVTATEAAHPGTSVKVAVVAEIAPGFHINDHKPTLDYLIPTELKLEPTRELSVERVVYPKGELKKFEFSDQGLSVYQDKAVVGALLKLAAGVPPGEYTIKGKLAYQACNEHACLPPTSVLLSITVKVVPRGVTLKRVHTDVFDKIQFD